MGNEGNWNSDGDNNNGNSNKGGENIRRKHACECERNYDEVHNWPDKKAEYKSAEDLATGIEWLYHDEHAPEIQKEARRSILMHFSEEVVADQHLQLYQELLNRHPK